MCSSDLLDHPECITDGICTRGAGGAHRSIGAAQFPVNGQISAGGVDDEFGDHEGRDAVGAAVEQHGMLQFDFIEPTDAAAHKDSVAIRITDTEVDPGLADGLFSGHECELGESIGAAQIAAVDLDMGGGIKLTNLAPEAHLEIAAVKSLYGSDAALSATQCVPDVVQFAAKRGDNAKACHHYSTA